LLRKVGVCNHASVDEVTDEEDPKGKCLPTTVKDGSLSFQDDKAKEQYSLDHGCEPVDVISRELKEIHLVSHFGTEPCFFSKCVKSENS
jgi:hypothetical protein